jgi:hypothetical protein
MGAIRPGNRGGATTLGDLTDIGVMGEPIAESDNLTEVMTALGGASAVRAAVLPSVSYALTGGAHDYTADSAYAGGGTGNPYAISDLLGDGVAVPKFEAMNTSIIAALTRTTVPSLRVQLNATNGAPWLPFDSATDGGASLLIRPPYWIERAPAWRVTLRVALNFPGVALAAGGTDYVAGRVGVVRYGASDGIAQTVAGVDIFSNFPDGSGEISEGHYVDGTTTYASRIVLTGETSGGVNARDVRFTVSGSGVKVETATVGGGYTSRLHLRSVRRRGARGPLALGLSLGQSRATPIAGYWLEIRSLTFEEV